MDGMPVYHKAHKHTRIYSLSHYVECGSVGIIKLDCTVGGNWNTQKKPIKHMENMQTPKTQDGNRTLDTVVFCNSFYIKGFLSS